MGGRANVHCSDPSYRGVGGISGSHREGEAAESSATSGGGMQGSGAYLGMGGYPGFSHSRCSSFSAVRSWACHSGDSSISFNRRSSLRRRASHFRQHLDDLDAVESVACYLEVVFACQVRLYQ